MGSGQQNLGGGVRFAEAAGDGHRQGDTGRGDRGRHKKQGLGSWEQGQKPGMAAPLPLERPRVWEAAAAADGPGFEGREYAGAVSEAARG